MAMGVRSQSEDVKRINLDQIALLVKLLGIMSLGLGLIQVRKGSVRPWVGTAGACFLREVEGIVMFGYVLFVQIRFYGSVSHDSDV